MFPAFGLSVYKRDKMADYSSAWRVITRIVTDYFFYHEDISLSRIILLSHGESRMIYLSRIIELSNFSSHGESRTSRRVFLSRICEFANYSSHVESCDGHGRSLRIYLSRICEFFFTRMVTDGHGGFICHEFANCSSHGWSRRVTEDFYGMRPLLWTY